MNQKFKILDIDSSTLHIIAMLFMLCDHAWATIIPGNAWLTCIGRLAFPIFAFLLVEGYYHTHNFKKYLFRMLGFAILSEIPFNYMYGGTAFYPFHQNVLWGFLIALVGMYLIDRVKKYNKIWLDILLIPLIVIVFAMLGIITMVDYNITGILTVFVFYFFHGKKWWCILGQLACLYYLNVNLLGGIYYPINIFGIQINLVQQSLALLSLIPIWLYNGRKGYDSKTFKYFCYAFYPLHILVLVIFAMLFK